MTASQWRMLLPANRWWSLVIPLCALASAAAAHSLNDLESSIRQRETHVAFTKTETEPFPDFAFQDADNRTVATDSLREMVTVVNFTYMRCKTDDCRRRDDLIVKLQKDIAVGGMADHVRFVSITVDPAHDSVDDMTSYGSRAGFDARNWIPLRSKQPSETEALVRRLGLKVVSKPGDPYSFPVVFYVIDREGHLRARFLGLDFEPLNLVLYVNALVNDVHHHHQANKAAAKP